jgi:signal transduction histidine kinase
VPGQRSSFLRRALDAGLVLLVVALQSATVRTGREDPPEPGLLGFASGALGLLQGLLLLAHRRRPGPVAVAVCLLYAVQAAFAGAVLPAAPWLALAWLVSTPAPRRWLAMGVAILGVGMAAGALAHPATQGTVPLLVALTAVIVLAATARTALRARAEALQARAAETARRLASQERLALARELHDSIGHGLSAVAVQSSAARMALEAGDRETAARSVAAVEESSRAALREMRDLVAVLRDADGSLAPTTGLADLDGVLRRTRHAGVAASLEMTGDFGSLPPGMEATVYRIVQEGLTNVVRHAPGAWARVRVAVDGAHLLVDVEDGGVRGAPSGSDRDRGKNGGYGLAGLRERVQLVGGTLEAGPLPAGAGWRLAARLPMAPQEARAESGTR